jgi:hypothetical protein
MVVFASLLALTSCSTNVQQFEASPTTSRAAFTNDGLAILGCTSTVDTLETIALSDKMCGALAGSLVGVDAKVRLTPWKVLKPAVGADEARVCLGHVLKRGALTPSDLDSLTGNVEKARYVVVHRIERDEVTLDQDNYYEDVNGKSTKTGKTYQTKRSMTATFWVYEMKTRERVWMATVDGNKQEEVTRRDGVDDDGVLEDIASAIGTVDDVLGNYEQDGKPYPAPPSPEEVMLRIYKKFSGMLLAKD